ncbi:tRNA (5-methylaminomethyl-2-thiouridine)(34)-methyltransferase MnmD [Glycocaulis sp.]
MESLVRPFAQIDWSDPAAPRAAGGDVYFSAENGLAETEAVFLKACRLDERFGEGGTVIIGELGFGTGLNFLAAWQLFERVAPANARLHFVSVEGFPLRQDDAVRALSAFPQVSRQANALTARWPLPLKGPQRRVFAGGRVVLTVFHDEVAAALNEMDFAADAWFLDGFAPALNADMWADAVFAHIARLSRPGARAGTFTVAGAVRRGLSQAGFAVEKVPGFGRKRERLEAVFEGPARARANTPANGPVAVIGTGIAGLACARALAARSLPVTLIGAGESASAGPAVLMTPRLEAADRPHVRATLAAFEYARAMYEALPGFEASGALRLADGEGAERLERIAAMMAGAGLRYEDGLHMQRAGLIRPNALLPALKGEIPFITQRVAAMRPLAGGGWALLDEDGQRLIEAAHVILATGPENWPEGVPARLPVEALPGQVAVFALAGEAPPAPVTWGHYVAGLGDGRLLAGATHERGKTLSAEEAVSQIRAAITETLPELGARLGNVEQTWRGVRATLPDRLPAAGPVCDEKGEAIDGLWTLAGLGARGFAHAPLLAETIASAITGEPSPLERTGAASLHPGRFALRALKKGGGGKG